MSNPTDNKVTETDESAIEDTSEMKDGKPFYRRIRSFVKREGKLTTGQQAAIDEQWADFGIDHKESALDMSELFGNEQQTVLEIGFGNGVSLADMAEAAPETNFLGIEVHKPGLGSLLVHVKQRGLSNVRVSGDDAVEVLQRIPDNSLDRLQIFFPDPWHKKRHNKRRLINAKFAQAATQKLKVGGVFHVATDWENYAEQVLEVLNETSSLKNQFDGYGEKPAYRPETKYERRGINLGHGVWDMLFERTA